MHNESRNDPEPNEPNEPKPVKPSKRERMKSIAVSTGMFVIPVVVTGGIVCLGAKTSKMNFDTAKLNLEAAKLAAGIANTQS